MNSEKNQPAYENNLNLGDSIYNILHMYWTRSGFLDQSENSA